MDWSGTVYIERLGLGVLGGVVERLKSVANANTRLWVREPCPCHLLEVHRNCKFNAGKRKECRGINGGLVGGSVRPLGAGVNE